MNAVLVAKAHIARDEYVLALVVVLWALEGPDLADGVHSAAGPA